MLTPAVWGARADSSDRTFVGVEEDESPGRHTAAGCGSLLSGYLAVTIVDRQPPAVATVDAQADSDAPHMARLDEVSGLGVRFPRGAPNVLTRPQTATAPGPTNGPRR